MTRGLRTSSSLVIRYVSSYSGPVGAGQPVPHASDVWPQGPILAWERMASGILDRVRSEIRALKQEIAAIETLCETREQPREPAPRRAA